jgi:hypothetical protein
MIADEVSIYVHMSTQSCPPCENLFVLSLTPPGGFLMIAAAIIYISGRIVLLSKAAPSSMN